MTPTSAACVSQVSKQTIIHLHSTISGDHIKPPDIAVPTPRISGDERQRVIEDVFMCEVSSPPSRLLRFFFLLD